MESVFPVGSGGFTNPQKLLSQLDIKEGATVADFGCGHGYFVLPFSKIVGPEGKVYALDVLKEALESVQSKAETEKASNVEMIRVDLEIEGGSKLDNDFCDVVLLANILFQSQKKEEILKEAKRVTKPGGLVAVVDWLPDKPGIGPSGGWRISAQALKDMLSAQGLGFVRHLEVDQYHFGMVFKKS